MNFNPKAPQVYRPNSQQAASPKVRVQKHKAELQLKPVGNFRNETRPAPAAYRPNQGGNSAQLKAANNFQLETRPAPPVYRPQQSSSAGVQLKPGKNFRLETRSGPAVYRLEPLGSRVMQQKPQTKVQTSMSKLESSNSGVSRTANGSVQRRFANSRPVVNPGTKSGVVQRMESDDLVERLIRSNNRNLTEKSQPVGERSIFDLQDSSSYGFENNVIDEDMLKGQFRKGWGGQPFLSLSKDDFGGAVVKSDYDAIVAVFQKDKHSEDTIAEDILARIDHGTVPKGYSDETLRAMSTLIQLTQVIESHSSRVPGADKYARASLSRILNGESSFHAEFNRKNGNYLPARAKAGGSKFGGQEATLALVGKPKKSHKAKRKDVVSSGVLETLEVMSDSSGDEGSDDELMSE